MMNLIPCPYIEELDSQPRFALVAAARLFLERNKHLDTDAQIALQRPPGMDANDPAAWTEACGSFHDTDKLSGDYTVLNPGTEWVVPLLEFVEAHSGMKACRTRIMTMQPGRCLSYHKDVEKWRYHFVVVSNTSARFLVSETVGNMPVVGGIYRLRTDLMHTALNPTKRGARTHIVVCVGNT
jgi:hypothetical protein